MYSRDLERNPPAFPVSAGTFYRDGMELRDWFAGLALQGELSCEGDVYENDKKQLFDLAGWCYQMADAMLAERAKGRDSDV